MSQCQSRWYIWATLNVMKPIGEGINHWRFTKGKCTRNYHLWGVVFLTQPPTRASWTNSSEFHDNWKKGIKQKSCKNAWHPSLPLSWGKQPVHALQLDSFESPDSATAWGLPGCHSPRHAPGMCLGFRKRSGVFGINLGVDDEERMNQSPVKCFLYFLVNARGKPPSSRSVFNCYPQWSGGNSKAL